MIQMESESEGYSKRGLIIVVILIVVVMILLLGILYWKDIIRYITSRLNLKFFVE